MRIIKRCLCGISVVFVSFIQCLSALSTPASDPCSAGAWQPPGYDAAGVMALLQPIKIGTKWADLPPAVRAGLQAHADSRLAAFRARWGKDALERKEVILL